jgi:hypothetical protein
VIGPGEVTLEESHSIFINLLWLTTMVTRAANAAGNGGARDEERPTSGRVGMYEMRSGRDGVLRRVIVVMRDMPPEEE